MKKNKLTIVIIIMTVTFLCLIGYFTNLGKMSFVENGVGNKISDSFKFITNISNVKKENEELRKTNNELQTKSIINNTLIRENKNMKSMRKFSNKTPKYNYIGAEIIGLNKNSFSDGYIINIGENKGIKKGMIAMTGEGLVGKISSVGNTWSIVQCLFNQNIAVAAIVEGSKSTDGIVRGYQDKNNKLLAKIQHLSLNSNVKKGAVIVTSGLGGIYPAGIKIGKVLSVQEDKSEIMKSAIINPSVDFTKIEEVFIVESKDSSGIKY